MSELAPKRFENKRDNELQFTIASGTLKVVQESLKRPFLPPNSVAAAKCISHAEDLSKRLPLATLKPEVPVSLSGQEVNFISYHMAARSKEGENITSVRHAFWDLNLQFIEAGGSMQSNFEVFLKRYNLSK